jgi:hypothetical protein
MRHYGLEIFLRVLGCVVAKKPLRLRELEKTGIGSNGFPVRLVPYMSGFPTHSLGKTSSLVSDGCYFSLPRKQSRLTEALWPREVKKTDEKNHTLVSGMLVK